MDRLDGKSKCALEECTLSQMCPFPQQEETRLISDRLCSGSRLPSTVPRLGEVVCSSIPRGCLPQHLLLCQT